MLYVTTRSDRDMYTAHRALCEDRGPDGGFYVPFRFPTITTEEIQAFSGRTFNQNVAVVLNMLFNCRIEGWDVDFAVGRYPVRLKSMSHRVILGECWHNPHWDINYFVRNLADVICGENSESWMEIAARMAVLCGVFGELFRFGITLDSRKVDIAVVADDFTAPMAAWYVRKMGFPVGNIICCCDESSPVWDLFHLGVLKTGTVAGGTSELPASLERLIYEAAGSVEVNRYLNFCGQGGLYRPDEVTKSRICEGIDISVVRQKRLQDTIRNVNRTYSYMMASDTAMAYTGLLDYRARTGETRPGLILCDKGVECDVDAVASAMGVSPSELRKHIRSM